MAAGEKTQGHSLRHALVCRGAGSARGPPGEAERAPPGEAERALCPRDADTHILSPLGCCGSTRGLASGMGSHRTLPARPPPPGTSFQMILEHPGALDAEAVDEHTYTRLRGSRPLTPIYTPYTQLHTHRHSSLTRTHTCTHHTFTRAHTTHTHTCAQRHSTHTHTRVHTCTDTPDTTIHMHTDTHYTHAHVCAHIHRHRHTTHAHVHTHTPTLRAVPIPGASRKPQQVSGMRP